MAVVVPFRFVADVDDPFDFEEDDFGVFIVGVHEEHVYAVDYVFVGLSVEYHDDSALFSVEIVEGSLVGFKDTPGWVAT